MYVATSNTLLKTTDGGATWIALTTALGGNRSITTIIVDPRDPDTVYIGTSTNVSPIGAVFKTADGGATWRQLGAGFPDVNVNALALDPEHAGKVVAATLFAGVLVYRPCGHPLVGCRAPVVPSRSRLVVNDRSPDRRDALTWKWGRGEATEADDFGDPFRTTEYVLCVYDDAAASPRAVIEAHARVGTRCADVGCWRGSGPTRAYRDATGGPGGVRKMNLTAGSDGSARVTIVAGGEQLRLPPLPLVPPVTVQLDTDGACWQADYGAEGIRRNDGAAFSGRGTGP
jgi:hypothetical protein